MTSRHKETVYLVGISAQATHTFRVLAPSKEAAEAKAMERWQRKDARVFRITGVLLGDAEVQFAMTEAKDMPF